MKSKKNYEPDFMGVFSYCHFYDDEASRAVVLAVAGYSNPQDAAREIHISEHQAEYLWKYLKRRDALFGGKHYTALTEWAEGGAECIA